MKLIKESAMARPSIRAKGLLDEWKKARVFPRAIDGYAFAAAFAMRERLTIDGLRIANRSDLVEMGVLEKGVRRALEAGIYMARKRSGLSAPASEDEVLDQLSHYAEAGIVALADRWGGKSKSQILEDIRAMVTTAHRSSNPTAPGVPSPGG